MKRTKNHFSTALVYTGLVGVFMAACASTNTASLPEPNPNAKTEALSTPTDPNQPCWVSDASCRDTEKLIAVVGRSKEYVDAQSAEQDSILDAQRRAGEFVETQVVRVFDEVAHTASRTDQKIIKGIAGDDATHKRIDVKVKNLRPITYTRRWTVTQYGIPKEHWESFAFIVMPVDMNSNIAKERLEEEKHENPANDPLIAGAEKRLLEMRQDLKMKKEADSLSKSIP